MSNNNLPEYGIESSNLKAKRKASDYSSGSGSNKKAWRKFSGHSKNSYESGSNISSGNIHKGRYRRERFNSEGNSKWGSYNYYYCSNKNE